MFGDTTDQTNTAPAADGAMNPAQPPADTTAAMGGIGGASVPPVSTMPGAPDMTFPSVPNTDPITVADATATNDITPPADATAPTDTPVPEPSAMPDPLSMPAPADTTDSTEPVESSIPEPIATAPSEEAEAAGPAEVLASEDTGPTVMSTDDNSSSDDSATDTSDSDDATTPSDDSSVTDDASDEPAPGSEELIGIKQQALEDLGPLVDKLDQSPEERFRTTMMLIQASDNQVLVKQAFDAAQEIKDDKERAQALLDVINEINYFTTQNK
jgi:hypothetical protein